AKCLRRTAADCGGLHTHPYHTHVSKHSHSPSRSGNGCSGPWWTRYYTIYRQSCSMERQTIYRLCPGWSWQDNEPGCLCSVSAVGTCFHGERCSEGEVRQCQCSEGFQGPRCQY
ncbi:hypothetical protein EI555_012537, partial [Monodon monoceros]